MPDLPFRNARSYGFLQIRSVCSVLYNVKNFCQVLESNSRSSPCPGERCLGGPTEGRNLLQIVQYPGTDLLDLGRRMVTILRTGGKRKKTEAVPFTEVLRGKHSQLPAGVAQW